MNAILEGIKNAPGILELRRWRYERQFASHQIANYFRGVYTSFEDAAATAPKSKPIGYDNSLAASMYTERTERVYGTDYPVLYWMNLLEGKYETIFDFGGHIGIHYYSYAPYLNYSGIKKWLVCDVPAVIESAKKFKRYEEGSILNFSLDFEDCEGTDLFLANGSLQYLEWELHSKLARLQVPPKFLIVNMTPLHKKYRSITLQSIGTSFCPYHLRVDNDFVGGLEEIGYKLIDEWENEEKACKIAFEPERSLDYYKGMIFQLER